jgi:hypothetical protein
MLGSSVKRPLEKRSLKRKCRCPAYPASKRAQLDAISTILEPSMLNATRLWNSQLSCKSAKQQTSCAQVACGILFESEAIAGLHVFAENCSKRA